MDELKPMGNLGQGASGVVMRVLHMPSNMDFALKVVNIPFDQNEKKIRHLISELKTLFMSKCPNIVSFHGAFYKVRPIILPFPTHSPRILWILALSAGQFGSRMGVMILCFTACATGGRHLSCAGAHGWWVVGRFTAHGAVHP